MPTNTHACAQAANAALRFLAGSNSHPTRRPENTPGLPKRICRAAFKKVARHLGLKPNAVAVLDAILAPTKPKDWEDGWPVSYISNAKLMRDTDLRESQLSALIRRLHDMGIVNRRYAANGHRWAKRDPNGRIVEASGIDLSPMIAKAHEWQALAAREEEREAARKARCREIVDSASALRVALDTLDGFADDRLDEIAADLHNALPRRVTKLLLTKSDDEIAQLEEVVADLTAEVGRLCESLVKTQESGITVPQNRHHIRTPSQLDSSSSADCADAQTQVDTAMAVSDKEKGDAKGVRLPIYRLPEAFPNFWSSMGSDWNTALHELPHVAAGHLQELGLRESVWRDSRKRVGDVIASLAVALTYERLIAADRRRLDDPTSPGGYFVGCIRNAEKGEFNIAASIHGFAEANARTAKRALTDDAI